MHQHRTLEDTVYFWFPANDTSGSGADGATPLYDVRLGGAAADAAPVLSGSATLLTHANYAAGCHEIAVAATAGNGFAAGNTYGVFSTLLVDSQNPTGFVGSFSLDPIPSTMATAAMTALADVVLNRAMNPGGANDAEDNADKHSLAAAVMLLTNWSISGSTLSAMKPSDDSTFQNYTLVTTPGVSPVTGVS